MQREKRGRPGIFGRGQHAAPAFLDLHIATLERFVGVELFGDPPQVGQGARPLFNLDPDRPVAEPDRRKPFLRPVIFPVEQRRAERPGRAGKIDETNWALEVLAIRDLYLLVDWCSGHKLKVSFAKKSNGEYRSCDKQIIVSTHLSPRKQVVVLLHECGHHLIDGQDIQDRFALGYSQINPEIIKTFSHRLACLEEEFEAWHRGWKLAKRLSLTVDRDYFDE